MDQTDKLVIKDIFDDAITPLRSDIHALSGKVDAVYHELYGVQGNNGMKKDVTDLKTCTQKMEIRMAKWVGGITVGFTVINILLKVLL